MSSTRTQVYLTQEQRAQVDQFADSLGITMAEVIRRALTAYLSDIAPDSADALTSTFGAITDLTVPRREQWARG